MKVYYAHCMAIYETPQEERDMALLRRLFPEPHYEIVNPNNGQINARCLAARIKLKKKAGTWIINRIFKPLVEECAVLAFRALPDGRIPAGVAKEIAWAINNCAIVIELPSNFLGRIMPLDQTKAYLREIGQR